MSSRHRASHDPEPKRHDDVRHDRQDTRTQQQAPACAGQLRDQLHQHATENDQAGRIPPFLAGGSAAALVASTEIRTPYDAPATAMSALASNFAVMVASRDEADGGVVDQARRLNSWVMIRMLTNGSGSEIALWV